MGGILLSSACAKITKTASEVSRASKTLGNMHVVFLAGWINDVTPRLDTGTGTGTGAMMPCTTTASQSGSPAVLKAPIGKESGTLNCYRPFRSILELPLRPQQTDENVGDSARSVTCASTPKAQPDACGPGHSRPAMCELERLKLSSETDKEDVRRGRLLPLLPPTERLADGRVMAWLECAHGLRELELFLRPREGLRA